MDNDRNPRRSDLVVARRAGETVILLDPSSGEYFTLDDVGGRVWELCDGSRTVSEIVDAIAREYDAPRERIQGDVSELLAELAGIQLVAA